MTDATTPPTVAQIEDAAEAMLIRRHGARLTAMMRSQQWQEWHSAKLDAAEALGSFVRGLTTT